MTKAQSIFEKLAKKKCKKKKKAMSKIASKSKLTFKEVSKIYKNLAENAVGLKPMTKIKMRAKADAANWVALKNTVKGV
jgi:hypothetical protein